MYQSVNRDISALSRESDITSLALLSRAKKITESRDQRWLRPRKLLPRGMVSVASLWWTRRAPGGNVAVSNLASLFYTRSNAIRLDRHLVSLVVLIVAYVPLVTRRDWLQFVDESDNFLGGYLIAHGEVLYRDYFSHHMPLPYYLAAIPALLGAHDLGGFRAFTSLVILAFWAYIVVRFWKRIPPAILSVLILTIAIGCWSFYGNMLLAETIEAYCLLIVCLSFYAFPDLDFGRADQLVVALAVFGAAMCTLLSFYPFAILLGYYVYRRIRTGQFSNVAAFIRQEAPFAALLVIPFVATACLLAVTGSLATFVQDAFIFNQVYYSKYALAGDPLRVLAVLLRSDYHLLRSDLQPLAWTTFGGFGLIANAFAFVLVVRGRGLAAGLTYAAVAATSRGRGVAFHDEPYYLLSIGAVSATMIVTGSWLLTAAKDFSRGLARGNAVRGALALGAAVYLLLIAVFYVNLARAFPWESRSSNQLTYQQVIQATTRPGDKIWIVPLNFYDYLMADRMPATRYAFYLPWLADSPAINTAILHDLAR